MPAMASEKPAFSRGLSALVGLLFGLNFSDGKALEQRNLEIPMLSPSESGRMIASRGAALNEFMITITWLLMIGQ
jgi:hypothetical protein